MNKSQFLNKKLELKKPEFLKRQLLSLYQKERARVGGNQGGTHNMGLRPDTIQSQRGPKLVTQHLIVVTQNDPQHF